MERQDDAVARACKVLVATALAAHPHLSLDPAWLAAALAHLPEPDRAMVARVAAGGDLDAAARALGVTRRRFDGMWATLLVSLVRRGRAEGALRRGRVGERERSLARRTAIHLRERGWQAGVRDGSVAAVSADHHRVAIEAVGEGRWALQAAIGEARGRAAGTPGVRAALALDHRDVRALRALATTEPGAVPADLVVFVVEGAHVQETTVEAIAGPLAKLPRGPFAGGYG